MNNKDPILNNRKYTVLNSTAMVIYISNDVMEHVDVINKYSTLQSL